MAHALMRRFMPLGSSQVQQNARAFNRLIAVGRGDATPPAKNPPVSRVTGKLGRPGWAVLMTV